MQDLQKKIFPTILKIFVNIRVVHKWRRQFVLIIPQFLTPPLLNIVTSFMFDKHVLWKMKICSIPLVSKIALKLESGPNEKNLECTIDSSYSFGFILLHTHKNTSASNLDVEELIGYLKPNLSAYSPNLSAYSSQALSTTLVLDETFSNFKIAKRSRKRFKFCPFSCNL